MALRSATSARIYCDITSIVGNFGIHRVVLGANLRIAFPAAQAEPVTPSGGRQNRGNKQPAGIAPSGLVGSGQIGTYFDMVFASICARSSFVRLWASATCWGDIFFSRTSRVSAALALDLAAKLNHA